MQQRPQIERRLEELVERTKGLQPWRRLFHLVGGVCVALTVYTLDPHSVSARWLFGGMLAVIFLVDVLRLRFEDLNLLVFRAFGPLMCPREAERLSLTWFLLGVFLVLWFPGGTPAVPSILVLSFADPAASVVGRLWGTHPLGKGTMEGTLAFFTTSLVVLAPFVGLPEAFAVAALVAGAEVLPTGLDDNLLIPVTTAICLWGSSIVT